MATNYGGGVGIEAAPTKSRGKPITMRNNKVHAHLLATIKPGNAFYIYFLCYVVVGQAGDEGNIEKPLSTKLCTGVLIFCSIILIVLFFPFSLFYMVKVSNCITLS